jgi:hypothetical protein
VSFTQVFGGNTIYPSDVSYLALALTEDVILQWPLETATGNNIVARIIDVTPTDAYSIYMPDAMLTGVGQVTQFLNLGPDTITIKDSDGGTLLSITTGLTFTLYLTDNTTVAGTWESFQAGAATAQAQASQLAGYGLIAQGSLLSQSQPVTVFNSDFTLGAGNRAAAFVWNGGLGTLTLPTASSVGNDWFVAVRNSGEGNLTITAQGGDTINALSTLVLRPEDSATVITDGISFFTVGFGQQAVFAFDYTSINLAGETGDYTLAGAELNRIAYSFLGEIVGDVAVILPATTQQYWVANDTTGGSYTLSIGTDGQMAPIDVPRDSRGIYYCNGTDVVKADTASIALPIAINDGGTGASTAGGALINLGGTTVGIDVFTASTQANARTAIGAGTGSGTVTSVSGSGGSTGLTLAGGAITTTGTLTLGGTLAVASGGTGNTSYTDGQLLIGNSSGGGLTKATLTQGSGVTITNGNGTITINATGSGGSVTSVASGNGLTGGPITTTGTLSIDATYANAWTGQQTFTGSTSVLAMKIINALEKVTASATAATGTINYDVTTQSVLYYTSNASANWTVNLRASSGTSLDTAMSSGESVTAAFLVTQGATAYYNNVVQVDGTTSGVTTKWQSAVPAAGNVSGIDVYTYTVIKTGSAAFTVLASLTPFV